MLGVMFTWTTYGTWLRGDARGWVEKGITFPANPTLSDLDRSRLAHEPFLFDSIDWLRIGTFIGRSLIARRGLSIYALSVQSWHVHAVTSAPDQDWPQTTKCAKDAVRWGLRVGRPIWGNGFDKRYCFDERSLRARVEYVNRHNVENGWAENPWDFVTPLDWAIVSPR
jgi:hypothetical protein